MGHIRKRLCPLRQEQNSEAAGDTYSPKRLEERVQEWMGWKHAAKLDELSGILLLDEVMNNAELGVGKAQRATGHSAALIINAIIDQIGQGTRMKGGDEFGASCQPLDWRTSY
ncbi:unnamed protein product [Pleuronectes platessa]|uniref:Uncharacterized protein n=1 Tax=Pleuronectes platessa TaxID=8262 RepID=A0A9N7VT85_PLEPL|nr:unnamed protein product [Pleuronectes platessa]